MTPLLKIVLWIVAVIVIIGLIIFSIFVIRNVGNVKDSCGEDVFNCDNFATQDEAQDVFDACGGVDNDVHQLDRDGNGVACEGLG